MPRILERDPTCRLHLPGCTGESTEVDHVGHKLDHGDANLRGLCSSCHAQRTREQASAGHAAFYAKGRRAPERHPLDVEAERADHP